MQLRSRGCARVRLGPIVQAMKLSELTRQAPHHRPASPGADPASGAVEQHQGRLFALPPRKRDALRQTLISGAAQQACCQTASIDDRYWLLGVAAGWWSSPAIEEAADAALAQLELQERDEAA
jgi:hypothetical protein